MVLLPLSSATNHTILNPRALSSSSTNNSNSNNERTAATTGSQVRKRKMVLQQTQKKRPSVFEVQKAIGVVDREDEQRLQNEGSAPTMMDMLGLNSTGNGKVEGSIERKVRETSEWVVDQTESRALDAQKFILVVCFKILPVWIMLLLVASGVIKLPFEIPFLDNLLSSSASRREECHPPRRYLPLTTRSPAARAPRFKFTLQG